MFALVLLFACPGDEPATPPPIPEGPGPRGPAPGGPTPPGPPGPLAGTGASALSFGAVDLTKAAPADRRDAVAGAACAGCDVVVLTICSLRNDHVGTREDGSTLTPNLDRVAARALRFDRAYAASNFTLPSLTSLFTARFPSTTGVVNWNKGLATDVPVMAEVLGYYGYATGAFTVDAPSGFRPEFGLDRGFQRMVVSAAVPGTPDGRHGGDATGKLPAIHAADWISSQPRDRPIFAAYHDRNAHYPFVVDEAADDPTGVRTALYREGMDAKAGNHGHVIGKDPVAEAVRAAGSAGVTTWRETYAEAVSRMDAGLAPFFAALEARGRMDRTVLVVAADHGESLDEHDELLHGVAYFEGVVHVPLLVVAPGVTPGRTGALASHVDLFPTVAELIGATPPAGIDGVSLVPVLEGRQPSVRSTTLVEGGVMQDRPESLRGAVISPPWALLAQPPSYGNAPPPPGVKPGQLETRLYDLDADPEQRNDLAASRKEVVKQLSDRWAGFRAARAGQSVARELQHDAQFVELLQKNGYDFTQ